MASADDRPSRFEDHRGYIQDLLGKLDGVTEIRSVMGAIRGNHTHRFTTQWTYVVAGTMTFYWVQDDEVHERIAQAGEMVEEPPGVPHAWLSNTDTVVLVFTQGPRSGTAYETDTIRLDVPLLTNPGSD